MPDSPEPIDHIDETTMTRLREELQAHRDRLQGRLTGVVAGTVEAEPQDPLLIEPSDFGELGQEVTQEETELALSANDERLLAQIEHALQRMDEGTYGVSEITGRPIPVERLDALPWATSNVGDPR